MVGGYGLESYLDSQNAAEALSQAPRRQQDLDSNPGPAGRRSLSCVDSCCATEASLRVPSRWRGASDLRVMSPTYSAVPLGPSERR
jgi:hypothetical protein